MIAARKSILIFNAAKVPMIMPVKSSPATNPDAIKVPLSTAVSISAW